MQAALRSADVLVQILVVRGEKILGPGSKNVSACLAAQIRRVRDVVGRLGAPVSGAPVACVCEEPLEM